MTLANGIARHLILNPASVTASAPAEIPTTGLIARYKFDQGTGQQITDSVGTTHGQMGSAAGADTNDPTWLSPRGVSLDADDYGDFPVWAAGYEYTLIMVVRDVNRATNEHVTIANLNAGLSMYWVGTTQTLRVDRTGSTTNGDFTTPYTRTTAGTDVCIMIRHTTGTVINVRFNNGAWANGGQSTDANVPHLGQGQFLGHSAGSSCGRYYDWLVYDRKLDDAEADEAYDALKSELSGIASLP